MESKIKKRSSKIGNQKSAITIVGLGPGAPDGLTRGAWEAIRLAGEVYLRTKEHPTVAYLPDGVVVHSFDHLYENAESFEAVYEAIVERILALGRGPQGVVYAVPGDPFVAETTGPEISRRARAEGLPVLVIPGVSFLEPCFAALGVDPFPHTALVDAFALATAHHPPFPPAAPVMIAQIHSQAMAAEIKLTLMNQYPDDHPVKLIHGGDGDPFVEAIPLYEVDRSPHIGLLTSLYVPPLPQQTSFESLQEVVAHLRAPDGCPWDREQTLLTMRPYLLEETHELLEALDMGDPDKTREELGDVLLMAAMIGQIGWEDGDFSIAEALQGINTKLIHRHPHVFGDLELDNMEELLTNWERLKAEERAANGEPEKGLLDGVPVGLPALTQSKEYQKRASRVGFDWPAVEGVYEKVLEELEEIRTAPDETARAMEIGDLLFAVTHLANWYKVDPETALRETSARFKTRFGRIEAAAKGQGKAVGELSVDEMEEIWEAGKR